MNGSEDYQWTWEDYIEELVSSYAGEAFRPVAHLVSCVRKQLLHCDKERDVKVYEVAYSPEEYWTGVVVPSRAMADAVVAWLQENVHGGDDLEKVIVVREVDVVSGLASIEATARQAFETWAELHDEFGRYGEYHLLSECEEHGCDGVAE